MMAGTGTAIHSSRAERVVYLQRADNGAEPVRRYSHEVNKMVLVSPTDLFEPW
jgi:hypothetical protein